MQHTVFTMHLCCLDANTTRVEIEQDINCNTAVQYERGYSLLIASITV